MAALVSILFSMSMAEVGWWFSSATRRRPTAPRPVLARRQPDPIAWHHDADETRRRERRLALRLPAFIAPLPLLAIAGSVLGDGEALSPLLRTLGLALGLAAALLAGLAVLLPGRAHRRRRWGNHRFSLIEIPGPPEHWRDAEPDVSRFRATFPAAPAA